MNKAHLLLLVNAKHDDLKQGARWMANLVNATDSLSGLQAGVVATSLDVYGRFVQSENPRFLLEANSLLSAVFREDKLEKEIAAQPEGL